MKPTQSIIIKKSSITHNYIASQPMSYDFYLLYLLATEILSQPSAQSDNQFKKNEGIDFYKHSSIACLVTSQLLLHKKNGFVELFAIYDLANTDDLCLPKSPKFIMTAKNFMNFMVQKNQLQKHQPRQFFIAIDGNGHAHLTTDLQSLEKKSFFASLHKKIVRYFFTK